MMRSLSLVYRLRPVDKLSESLLKELCHIDDQDKDTFRESRKEKERKDFIATASSPVAGIGIDYCRYDNDGYDGSQAYLQINFTAPLILSPTEFSTIFPSLTLTRQCSRNAGRGAICSLLSQSFFSAAIFSLFESIVYALRFPAALPLLLVERYLVLSAYKRERTPRLLLSR